MDSQSHYPDPVYQAVIPPPNIGQLQGRGTIKLSTLTQRLSELPKASQQPPEHYRAPIQVWDFVVSNALGFMEGNIVKYISRYMKKDGLKDLYKARDYLNKLIGLEEAKNGATGR